MSTNISINLNMLNRVAKALGHLREEVLFVGGAVSSLYVNTDTATLPRPTKDIDVSVQIASYAEMTRLSEVLASKGFFPATNSSVMYRYVFEEMFIDFIPFEPTALGPTNSWLKPGFRVAEKYMLEEVEIMILPVSYYLASKWEAFLSRGKNDPIMSHDLEDFIYVIDYHKDIVSEVVATDEKVKLFLIEAMNYLLNHPNRDIIIDAQLMPSIAEARRKMIIEKIEKISKNRN